MPAKCFLTPVATPQRTKPLPIWKSHAKEPHTLWERASRERASCSLRIAAKAAQVSTVTCSPHFRSRDRGSDIRKGRENWTRPAAPQLEGNSTLWTWRLAAAKMVSWSTFSWTSHFPSDARNASSFEGCTPNASKVQSPRSNESNATENAEARSRGDNKHQK